MPIGRTPEGMPAMPDGLGLIGGHVLSCTPFLFPPALELVGCPHRFVS
jgi:hypothetical protein